MAKKKRVGAYFGLPTGNKGWEKIFGDGELASLYPQLKVPAVLSIYNLFQTTVPTLSINVVDTAAGEVRINQKPSWLLAPENSNPSTSFSNHISQVVSSWFLTGNAYVVITRNTAGEILDLIVADPKRVKVQRNQDGEVQYVITDQHKRTNKIYSAEDILHIKTQILPNSLYGFSPFQTTSQLVALANEVMKARLGNYKKAMSPRMIGMLEAPLEDKQREDLQSILREEHAGNEKKDGFLALAGFRDIKVLDVSEKDLSNIDIQNNLNDEFLKMLRINKGLLTDNEKSSFNILNAQTATFASQHIQTLVKSIEFAYSKLLSITTQEIRIDMSELLRGDELRRIDIDTKAIRSAHLTPNEARRRIGLPEIDNELADELLLSRDLIPLSMLKGHSSSSATKAVKDLVDSGVDLQEALNTLGLNIN